MIFLCLPGFNMDTGGAIYLHFQYTMYFSLWIVHNNNDDNNMWNQMQFPQILNVFITFFPFCFFQNTFRIFMTKEPFAHSICYTLWYSSSIYTNEFKIKNSDWLRINLAPDFQLWNCMTLHIFFSLRVDRYFTFCCLNFMKQKRGQNFINKKR